MTTMTEPLRPLSLGEILDRTAQLYRGNFALFAGVSAVPMGVLIAAGAVIGALVGIGSVAAKGTASSSPLLFVLIVPVVLMAVVGLLLATVFSQAGMTRAAISANLGQRLKIREALKGVWPRMGSYLGLLMLQGLLAGGIPAAVATAIVVGLLFFAPAASGGAAASALLGFLAVVIVIAAFVCVVWLAMGCSLGIAVCVAEEKPAWDSLKRAWELSKGTRGRIFVMFLLVYALTVVISLIAYIPVVIVAAIAGAAGNGAQYAAVTMVVAEIFNLLINFTLQTLITPVYITALVLFYYDQRIRKEGFDIEWMMAQAGLAEVKMLVGAEQGDGISGAEVSPDSVKGT